MRPAPGGTAPIFAISLGCLLDYSKETCQCEKCLILLARPKRFELLTPRFVAGAPNGTATGTIEREAAMTMVVRHSPGSHRLTLGADKAYDVHEFVDDLRDLNVTPHIAQNTRPIAARRSTNARRATPATP